ncbi:MAG: hypothetical protein M3186_13020 [Actinomycetota bacterium]|nr:hypothetical protein [Actinomycetota bacterium]
MENRHDNALVDERGQLVTERRISNDITGECWWSCWPSMVTRPQIRSGHDRASRVARVFDHGHDTNPQGAH